MIIIYLLIGACSGLMSGLLGIGGGIIVVPALAMVFIHYQLMPANYVMHMAIGTSLAAMVCTASSALLAHAKQGTVRWDLVGQLLPGLIIGSVVGALATQNLPSHYLRLFFGLFLFGMSCRLLLVKWQEGQGKQSSRYLMITGASLIGLLSSMLGAGGGTMMIPFMLRYRVSLRAAAGTSVACGVGVGLVATSSFILMGAGVANLPGSFGYIYWPAFIGISLASVVFAPLGTRIARQLPTLMLKNVLALCLLAVSVNMLFFT